MNQADARIVIYPSIIMAVTVENVNQYYEMTEQKLKEYAVGNDSAEKENE